MIKENKRIEIVRSNKTWLSSMSQESCDAIFKTLSSRYISVKVTTVDNISDLESLVDRGPDLIFLGMKFIPKEQTTYSQHSEKIWITEYLDDHDIPYTGSSKVAHELSIDKSLAKHSVSIAGVNTSPYVVVNQMQAMETQTLPDHLDFPLFIKPSNRGGGLGVDSKSVVNNISELEAKVQSVATTLGSDSLIEKYLSGREFSVAVKRDELSGDLVAMPIELVAPMNAMGQRMLSGHVKSSNSENVSLISNAQLKAEISELALEAFAALGARDYGRIDIRLDENGVPHFLEANLIPSLIDGYGSFPKACYLNADIGFEEMLLSIVDLAFARYAQEVQGVVDPFSLDNVTILPDAVVI